MKRLTVLLLVLSLFLRCAQALAADVVIPGTIDAVNAPERPALDYTLTEQDGAYVVTTTGIANKTLTNSISSAMKAPGTPITKTATRLS